MTATIPEMLDKILEPASLSRRPERSRQFAADFGNSLRSAFSRYGDLTHRQYSVLQKLYAEATAEPVKVETLAGITSIRELFDRAAGNGLKRPSITVMVDDCELELSRAPDTGRNPGAIYVKGDGDYLGKIIGTEFNPLPHAVRFLTPLVKFGNDPAGVAAASGHLTGRCSFCNRKLTDDRSTAVGYGPTCADNFGLPWGE